MSSRDRDARSRDRGDRSDRGEPRYPPQSGSSGRGQPQSGSGNGNGIGYNDVGSRDRLNDLRAGVGVNSNYSTSSSIPRGNNSNSGGSALFLDTVDAVRSDLDRIQRQLLPDLVSMQQRIVSSTQPNETHRLTSQMNSVQDNISAVLQTARKSVKKLSAENANLPAGAESHSRKGQLGTLAKKLMSVADEFQNAQRSFRNKYKQRMEREIRIARPDATPQEIARALDSASGSAFSQQLLSSRNDKVRRALEEVQDRHTELQKIERSLTELFDLFQEMQQLIETQQEMINNVESNVENSVAYIEEGSKELTKAIVYKKNSRKKQWWIMIVVLILLIIVGVVVYFQVIKPML
ncbi:UNVERIFIED_CONTAM: Plasma membrane t-SNARE, secretory vesicle fusion [Siphonaria sp. JEL0065]|nr:Plasma membrane t-SNARE, secretory vesicle fusion [Siphonaria sp. JEL0065]